MNILLVDDDVVDRATVKRSLNKGHSYYQITETDSAEEALHRLKCHYYDVVLLDYQLPQMNGVELVVKFKNESTKTNTAIVMISSSNSEELILECLNAGAQDFLLKEDISPGQLSRTLIQAQRRFELESKLYESYRQVKEMAELDTLTGLANRYRFDESLRSAIRSNQRENGYVTLFIFDLDHFKNINDSFGHDIGDKLLQSVAERVSTIVRDSEVFARLGGDEFALIFTNFGHINQIMQISQRILDSFKRPFNVGGQEIHCNCSIGIALHPLNGQDAEELKKFADIAMYRAKNSGRNTAYLFEDNMQVEFYRKYQIEVELRKAIENQDFCLYFQPIVDIEEHQVVGFESLIRWPCAVTCQRPDEFISVAEDSRLIFPLGQWIIDNAIKGFVDIRQKFPKIRYITINISAYQLKSADLVEQIAVACKKYEVAPSDLVVEVTETALLSNDEDTKNVLNMLDMLGCSIALDDFGTGYSSISHLLNYPIHTVKLDKSLIDGCEKFQKHRAIISGLCAMLKSIDIKVVAEGIETQAQLDICMNSDVDFVQGYYFAKPEPLEFL